MVDDNSDVNPKNRGLGRGLDAIFGEDESANVSRETQDDAGESDLSANDIIGSDLKRREMAVECLRPCDFQPRKFFDEDALEDLARSIGMHGMLQPIVARPIAEEENQYEIIAGERRWRAAQMVQMHQVPVIIQYLDDAAVLEIALIENLQREDLTPIEEAKALQKLMDVYGHTQEKLSISIGKSRSAIANMLRLLQLPDSVQSMVEEGKLSAGHARSLIGQENAEELAKEIISDKLSVRDIEQKVKKSKSKKQAKSADMNQEGKNVNTAALEEEMSRILGMAVTIKSSKNNSGFVKVDFKSLDQLDDVLHRLSKG